MITFEPSHTRFTALPRGWGALSLLLPLNRVMAVIRRVSNDMNVSSLSTESVCKSVQHGIATHASMKQYKCGLSCMYPVEAQRSDEMDITIREYINSPPPLFPAL